MNVFSLSITFKTLFDEVDKEHCRKYKGKKVMPHGNLEKQQGQYNGVREFTWAKVRVK